MRDILQELIVSSPDHAISYAKYMETVLYYPKLGYYNQMKPKVGKSGDFITSVTVNEVFAKVMADAFYQYIQKSKLPVTICEIGGATGAFAATVVQHFRDTYPDAYENLSYIIIEQSPYHRKLAQEQLSGEDKITMYDSLEAAILALPEFQGLLFSNELFDALPVYEVVQEEESLKEVAVGFSKDHYLIEVRRSIEDEKLKVWLNQYPLNLQMGQRFDVPIAMTELIQDLSRWMKKGILIAVDYGYEAESYLQPERREGSLRGYYQHQLISNPLEHPGEMDLTTHIPLHIFDQACKIHGFNQLEITFQGEFLHHAGILNYLQEHSGRDPFSPIAKRNRAITSFLIGQFNQSFFVMVYQK